MEASSPAVGDALVVLYKGGGEVYSDGPAIRPMPGDHLLLGDGAVAGYAWTPWPRPQGRWIRLRDADWTRALDVPSCPLKRA